jgi:ubiquinone/menaquinone biosynthesis C-methylase UbiE
MRVIDFGCGQGSLSLGFAPLVAPGEVVGIDIAAASIEQARAQAAELEIINVSFRVADIHDAQLTDETFDVAHFSGVLAYQRDPLEALRVAHRVLRPGGLIAARDPQKSGDWHAGPHREAMTLFNGLVIEDAFKSVGGDPFIGRRLGTLLRDAGFERLDVTPAYALTFSNARGLAAWVLARLGDAAFSERVVRRGWISAEQLADLSKSIKAWGESDTSVAAVAECTALGWKPIAV